MTLSQANINAAAKIASSDDALNVAIEMLDNIAKGKLYDSLEFLMLVNRMKFMRSKALIEAVKDHARTRLNDGWHLVFNVLEDEDIRRIISDATTVEAAIKKMSDVVAVAEVVSI